jgi:DUF971 family protein
LSILWSDEHECVYPLAILRRNCPCATCQTENQSRGAAYIPLFGKDALTLVAIEPQGYYALKLIWNDGHSTGIYLHSFLRKLGEEFEQSGGKP